REGPDGWAAIRWKYRDGNMVAEGYYGSDGRLTELKRYNSQGDLIAKKYMGDTPIDPSEEYNPDPGAPGETESFYDSYGRLEGTTEVEEDPVWFPGMWPFEDF
ncbi:MAG: hypothetical protein ABH883_01280, partial [Candidatus Omnitrophota bacterium]